MIIGVDFGNINSFPAIVSGIDKKTNLGGVEEALLPGNEAIKGIPSVFHCNRRGDFKYGKAALAAAPINNRRDLLKRRINSSEKFGDITVNYNDVITGMIKHIVDTANRELVNKGQEMTNRISLAYPVGENFNISLKETLRSLAEKAVLEDGRNVQVAGMIPEPAAAALEFLGTLPVVEREQDITVLVYDLGGGTFDASIVNAHQNSEGIMTSYEVLSQDGSDCAGNEFSDILEKMVRNKLASIGSPLPKSDQEKARFRADVEERKILLSNDDMVTFEGSDGAEADVYRTEYEAGVRSLIADTVNIARKLYDASSAKPERIVMTGGQSQMPLIKTMLERAFPEIRSDRINLYKPQTAIALGAARFGNLNAEPKQEQKQGSNADIRQDESAEQSIVTQLTGHMMGILCETDEGKLVYTMIPENAKIPMDKAITRSFRPYEPCTGLTFRLLQAKIYSPSIYNLTQFTEVCSLHIDFGTTEKVQPIIIVEVYIDKANTIHFSARDPENKFKTVKTTVKYNDFATDDNSNNISNRS